MAFDLTPEQSRQANRLILSVGSSGTADFLRGLDLLDDDLVSASYGFKIPRGTNLTYGGEGQKSRYLNPVDLSIIAAERGARKLIVDTRFGSEGTDLIADIDDWLKNFSTEEVMKPYEEQEKEKLDSRFYDDLDKKVSPEYQRIKKLLQNPDTISGIFPPSMLSVIISGNTDASELEVANQHALAHGVTLLGIIGTSKKSAKEFKQDGINPITHGAILGSIALRAGLTWLQTAAKDASDLKHELSLKHDVAEVVLAGTGAFTGQYPQSDHDRPVLIEHTSETDMYIVGASVFKATEPNRSYIDLIDAMPEAA